MTRIYFIRHGQTAWNIEQRYQGISDIPLNDEGKNQARRLSKRIDRMDVHKIFVSPLKRAFETAQIFAENKNIPMETVEQLKEINFGEWEGMTFSELRDTYGEAYINFSQNPHQYEFPGEKSLDRVKMRVDTALEKIIEENPEQNVAVVSHGGISKIALISLMGLELRFYNHFFLENTSISIVDVTKNRNYLVVLNDISHLEWDLTCKKSL